MMLTMLFQLLAAFPIAGLVAASPVAEVASYQCARGCGAFYDRCLTLAGHDKEVYCRHMQCKFYSIYCRDCDDCQNSAADASETFDYSALAAEISVDWSSGAIIQRGVKDTEQQCHTICFRGGCFRQCADVSSTAIAQRDVQDSCVVRCNSDGKCWEECHDKKASRDVRNVQRKTCYWRCTRIYCVWECMEWPSAHAVAAKEIEGTVVVNDTDSNNGNMTIDLGVQASTSSEAGACLHPAMYCFSHHCFPYCIDLVNAVDAPPATDCRKVCDPTKDFCVDVCAV